MIMKHFDGIESFASDTKYFTSTQIQGVLCQTAFQQTSIEDIAEQLRKEHKASPTAETVRNTIISNFADFSPHEFWKYISSLLQAATMSSLQYQKLRREPLVFAFDETNLEYAGENLFTKNEKKVPLYNRKKRKCFACFLMALQKGERPLTLAFLPVLLDKNGRILWQLSSNSCRDCI